MRHFLAFIVSWTFLAGAAFAHSFNVTMIVPAGETEPAQQAFLIASAERDSHANETSDGHLGGVDSNVLFVEYLGDPAASVAQALASSPDIVAVIDRSTPYPDMAASIANAGVWVFPLVTVSDLMELDFLEGPEPFDERFLQQTGTRPSETALRAYAAARMIDIAVRAQDGASDVQALVKAVEKY